MEKQLRPYFNDQKTLKPEPRHNFPRVAPSNLLAPARAISYKTLCLKGDTHQGTRLIIGVYEGYSRLEVQQAHLPSPSVPPLPQKVSHQVAQAILKLAIPLPQSLKMGLQARVIQNSSPPPPPFEERGKRKFKGRKGRLMGKFVNIEMTGAGTPHMK